MKKLVSINQMVEIAENLGWNISVSGNDYEFSKYSPEGEDFVFSVSGNSVGEIVREVKDYVKDFDPEEHVEMWVNAKRSGTHGVPSIKELVKDADAIKEMLEELASVLNK